MQTKYGRIILLLCIFFLLFKVFDVCARLSVRPIGRSPRRAHTVQHFIGDGRCPFGNNFSIFVKHIICYCFSYTFVCLHVVALAGMRTSGITKTEPRHKIIVQVAFYRSAFYSYIDGCGWCWWWSINIGGWRLTEDPIRNGILRNWIPIDVHSIGRPVAGCISFLGFCAL